jgi:hypothetical protein
MGDTKGGFDFSELGAVGKRQDQGVAVHLRHPVRGPLFYENGDGEKPVTVTVVGIYSETFRKNERERMDLISSGKIPAVGVFESVAQLPSAVVAWDGFFDRGERAPCEREAVSRVLLSEPWIAEQLVIPTREHERFFSPTSSA